MAFTAAQIMTLAGRSLSDETAVRWTYPELCGWINEAVKAVVYAKPSASSQMVNIQLTTGTIQSLDENHIALLRAVRNMVPSNMPVPSYFGGRMIRVATRPALDASEPFWSDPAVVPFTAEVRQVIYDEENPRGFYVYPGNDGTGLIEALVSVLPDPIAANGNVSALESYEVTVPVGDIYETPIFDFTLYRALSKDSTESNPAAAMGYYQKFAVAIGTKIQVESSNSPNSRAGVQAS